MKAARSIALMIAGSIGLAAAAGLAQTQPPQSYAIDQSRYFPTPAGERSELEQRLKGRCGISRKGSR